MKNKILICLLVLSISLVLVGCGKKKENNNTNNETNTNQTNEENNVINDDNNNTNNNNSSDDVIVDDEILDVDDEDNTPPGETVTVSQVINCDGCVYAYFSQEGDSAKKLGDSVANDEYTTDVNTLKTSGGKQRHNFFGLVLSGNTI